MYCGLCVHVWREGVITSRERPAVLGLLQLPFSYSKLPSPFLPPSFSLILPSSCISSFRCIVHYSTMTGCAGGNVLIHLGPSERRLFPRPASSIQHPASSVQPGALAHLLVLVPRRSSCYQPAEQDHLSLVLREGYVYKVHQVAAPIASSPTITPALVLACGCQSSWLSLYDNHDNLGRFV